jgi:uncharacterized protein YbjT (DUF2867 family)
MIAITTPAGQIGHQVLENLLGSGEALRVIARDPSRLPAGAQGHVEVIEGSHGDPHVVDEAFAGADAVFWLVPPDPRAESVEAAYAGFTRPAAEAFKRHAVKRVVGVSALGRGTPWAGRAGYVTGSLAMDDLIASTGVGYRALTMPSFMDNLLRFAEPIRNDGVFFAPITGGRKLPSCATRDIAAAAARLLRDDSWTGIGHVSVLGPEDISYNDMAEIISDVLGKPVRFQQIPGEALKRRMLQAGASEAMAQGVVDMWAAKNSGLDSAESRTREATTPTSFREWCEAVLKPAVTGEQRRAAFSHVIEQRAKSP